METVLTYSIIFLWLIQIFVLFALFLLFRQFGEVYLKSASAITRDGIPIGKAIPDFKVSRLSKDTIHTKKDLINQPSLIAFVSPECRPCGELLKEWEQAQHRYKGQVNLLLFVTGEEQNAKEWLAQHSYAGEAFLIIEEKTVEEFDIRVTPFGLVVNGEGIVQEKGLCGGLEHIDYLLSSFAQS